MPLIHPRPPEFSYGASYASGLAGVDKPAAAVPISQHIFIHTTTKAVLHFFGLILFFSSYLRVEKLLHYYFIYCYYYFSEEYMRWPLLFSCILFSPSLPAGAILIKVASGIYIDIEKEIYILPSLKRDILHSRYCFAQYFTHKYFYMLRICYQGRASPIENFITMPAEL